jgi:predicted nucleic acid-binding protein
VIASALQAGADVLYSEDLKHKHFLGGSLRILNPFLHAANQPV